MSVFGPNHIPLGSIQDAPLIALSGKSQLKGAELWATQPCLIMVVRRPGCMMCRAQAKELADLRSNPLLQKKALRLLAITHQEDSADEFARLYFGAPDQVFLDPTKTFYRAIGEGNLRTRSVLAGAFSMKAWGNYRTASSTGVSGNLSGDGGHLGGVLLVGSGNSGVQWVFREEEFGDKAPLQPLLAAIEQLPDAKQ